MKKQSLNALAASYRADLLYYIERAKLGKCPPHWQAYCFGEIAAAKGTDAYPEDGDAPSSSIPGKSVSTPADASSSAQAAGSAQIACASARMPGQFSASRSCASPLSPA